jgi:signal peptidase I
MEFLKKLYNFVLDVWQTVLIVASIGLVIWIFFYRPFQVSGESMFPTYKNKEYVMTSLISLKLGDPKKGDVIVFQAPLDAEKDYIKRVMAVPGDTIYLKDGFVYVNNKKLDESEYLAGDVRTYGGNFMREGVIVKVPPGNFIAMGDNRPHSSDSREWGFLPKDKIIGNSLFVYLPINHARLIINPFNEKN